jgi:hypothetical protein
MEGAVGTKGLVPRDELVDKDEISLDPSNLDVVDAATLRAQPMVAIDRSDPQSRSTGRSTPPTSLRRYFVTATKSVSFVSESNTIFLSVVSRAAELVIPSALVSITPGKFPTMTR